MIIPNRIMFGGMAPHQWLAIRRWALESRKDIERRRAAMAAELARIGTIEVSYARRNNMATEQRTGITATGAILKLCQAYIVHGGNPYDISLFLWPISSETIEFEEPENLENYETCTIVPGGGVVFPSSSEKVGSPGGLGNGQHMGGNIPVLNYPFNRSFHREPLVNEDTAALWDTLEYIDRYSKVELKETLQNIEWNIVKLCDLKEQLQKELIDMERAWGGTDTSFKGMGSGRFEYDVFSGPHRIQSMVAYVDDLIFETETTGYPDNFKPVAGKIATTSWLTPTILPDEGMLTWG